MAGGQTTVYVGQHYEKNVTTGQVTKYYFFGGQRVAMNKGGVLYYLAGDHLGTTSLVLDAGGNKVESRHYPYGGERWSSGTVPTDYRFTGQRLDGSINLYQMGARWYDGALGRWISPDTAMPDPTNPQNLNRFSFVLGNPLRYTDPSGHQQEEQVKPDEVPWWAYELAWAWSEEGPFADESYYQFLLAYYSDPATAESWAQTCSDIAFTLDWAGFVLSGVEAVASDIVIGGATGIGSLAGPEGAVAGFSVGMEFSVAMAGSSIFALPENALGISSFIATGFSDVFAGYTFPRDGGLAIGQDTIITARNSLAGLIPESNVDWYVSSVQLQYDYDRRNGIVPGASVHLPQQGINMLSLLFSHWW